MPHLNLVTTRQYISSHKSCILAINQFSFSPHEHTVQQEDTPDYEQGCKYNERNCLHDAVRIETVADKCSNSSHIAQEENGAKNESQVKSVNGIPFADTSNKKNTRLY
jgi:hypothetical protein